MVRTDCQIGSFPKIEGPLVAHVHTLPVVFGSHDREDPTSRSLHARLIILYQFGGVNSFYMRPKDRLSHLVISCTISSLR